MALAEAINEKRTVEALFFHYGQRNRHWEYRAADDVCAHFNVPLHEEVLELDVFRGNPIMGDNEEEQENVYLPCRNMVLLSIATARAERDGFSEIWTGLGAGSETPYPDASMAFLRAFELLAMIGSEATIMYYAPTMYLGKSQVLERAYALGVPVGKTRSCVAGRADPCGYCRPCRDLKQGKRLMKPRIT